MGSANFADEQPIHAVRLSAYCLDEVEVTVAAYAACVSAGMCGEPPTNQLSAWGRPGEEQRPVALVDWDLGASYRENEAPSRGPVVRRLPLRRRAPHDALTGTPAAPRTRSRLRAGALRKSGP